MIDYLVNVLIIALLVVINGFFSMSELAVVSSRRPRLEKLAKAHKGAQIALQLHDDRSQFLSALQVGITLVGIVAGAFGGESFAPPLQSLIESIPLLAPLAKEIATGFVVVVIAYATIVFGELVPKQMALRHPEAIAVIVSRPIFWLSKLLAPLVAVLNLSSKLVMFVLGRRGQAADQVTEEEVHAVIAQGVDGGLIEPVEKDFITNVMRLGDWPVRAVMVPRAEIDWVAADSDPRQVVAKLRTTPYSMLLVADHDLDHPLGIVQAKDLLRLYLEGRPLTLREALREPLFVRGDALAVDVLNQMKDSAVAMAVVVDSARAVEGIVTPADMLNIIVGGMEQTAFGEDPQIVRRDDGSWLVDGDVHVDVLQDMLGIELSIEEEEYHTVAGLVLVQLQQIPRSGEYFHSHHFRFEVVDMDGTRIDKVLISRASEDEAAMDNASG